MGKDLDQQRLFVAIHELGHYVAWRSLPGVRIVSVKVRGSGIFTSGEVTPRFPTGDHLDRGYLVGLLAGAEADRVRIQRLGGRFSASGNAGDLRAFRRTRSRHAPSRQWSESSLRAEARRIVRANWDLITELAPRLAHKGHL